MFFIYDFLSLDDNVLLKYPKNINPIIKTNIIPNDLLCKGIILEFNKSHKNTINSNKNIHDFL